MTRPVPVLVSAGQTAGLCWICWRPLEEYTDGEGRVFLGCPPCRAEIERLQVLERRLKIGAMLEGMGKAGVGLPAVLEEGAPSRGGYHRCRPGELRLARSIAASRGLVAAARATGLKYQTLYGHAKREGWRVKACGRGAR